MLKQEFKLDSDLKTGPAGSFEITVNGKTVVKKQSLAFPSEQEIMEAVSRELRP